MAIAFGCSCAAAKPTSDLLIGFHWSSLKSLDSNKAISDDYKEYINNLSSDERAHVADVEFFEDGAGRHAAP